MSSVCSPTLNEFTNVSQNNTRLIEHAHALVCTNSLCICVCLCDLAAISFNYHPLFMSIAWAFCATEGESHKGFACRSFVASVQACSWPGLLVSIPGVPSLYPSRLPTRCIVSPLTPSPPCSTRSPPAAMAFRGPLPVSRQTKKVSALRILRVAHTHMCTHTHAHTHTH